MIPSEYILKKLDRVDDRVYWNSVLPQLRILLKGVRFDKNSTRHIEVGKSVSEWEVKYAVRNPEDSSRALWIRRQFFGNYRDEAYCDTTDDPDLQSLQNDLLEWMDVNIGPTRKKFYEGIISHEAMIKRDKKNVAFLRYVEQWEEEITVLLLRELKKIIRLRGQWETNGCGLGLNGQVAAEFLHHSKVAHNLCSEFAGREDLLQRLIEIIRQPNKIQKDKRTAMIYAVMNTSSTQTTPLANYGALSLVIYGEPGSGKSAFIAKLADEIYQREIRGEFTPSLHHPSYQRKKSRESHSLIPTLHRKSSTSKAPKRPRPVLFRFCGTSENSLRSRSLIRSLRLQIQYLLGPTQTRFPKPPSDWELLNDLLKHHAVIILLDGVNTLEGGYEFLSHLTLHRDTRIVISISSKSSLSSSSSEPAAPSASTKSIHHDHQVALDSFRADDVMCVEIPQPSDGIRAIMQAVLLRKNRILTNSQWEIVMTQAAVEPSAIYLSMAVKIVEHWQSTQESPQLAPSLRGVVDQILDHVEIECGRTLCRLALGLITYSVRGINDNG
jgi:hypothetical protein